MVHVRHHHGQKSRTLAAAFGCRKVLVGLTTLLFATYFYTLSVSLHEATVTRSQGRPDDGGGGGGGGVGNSNNNNDNDNNNNNNRRRTNDSDNGNQSKEQEQDRRTPRSTFKEWKQFAVDLAGKIPSEIVSTLKEDDPFGVRTFEKQLQATEAEKQRFLSLGELQQLFPCPTQERISQPDFRDHDKAQAYANGTETYFLFFQHLRKAGGTNFCSLAEHNLPKRNLPRYYCMSDYDWDADVPPGQPKRCAGRFKRFPNDLIVRNMNRDHARIMGNEWDNFDPRFFELPATFTTSFRRPLDRALSQFRFECIEDRGCKIKNVTQWWNKRTDLTNVYTWTFAGQGVRKISVGTTPQDSDMRREAVGKALDVIARFNLVMVMEWLAYAPNHVEHVLGFKDTKTLTERVRPHNSGTAKREDNQEHHQLSAGDFAKASWTPENYLPPALYEVMSRDLALDEILTDAARRIFLERVVCGEN